MDFQLPEDEGTGAGLPPMTDNALAIAARGARRHDHGAREVAAAALDRIAALNHHR